MTGARVAAVCSGVAGPAADGHGVGQPATGWAAVSAGRLMPGARPTAASRERGLAGASADRHEAGRPATGWAAMPAGRLMPGARPAAPSREPALAGAPADRHEAGRTPVPASFPADRHPARGDRTRQLATARGGSPAGPALRSSR